MMISLLEIDSEMKKFGVNPELLAVLGVNGSEQFIGEIQGKPPEIVNKRICLKNPKRFMRVQQMTPQGLAVQFLIGDLDMVESGLIQVFASYGYYLTSLCDQSRGAMLELFLDFLRRKRSSTSPIVSPPSGIIIP